MAGKHKTRQARGSVRIIGGRWRGRRLRLPPDTAVRPTGDRIRETLFNWLAPILPGARCLDLFAGSGVLGFEALSRGAAQATLVDASPAVTAQLQALAVSLGADGAAIVRADAHGFLRNVPVAQDIVFVDPPFGEDLGNLCTLLAGGWLAPGARVYFEAGRDQQLPVLPQGWTWLRENTAGKVRFGLAGGPA